MAIDAPNAATTRPAVGLVPMTDEAVAGYAIAATMDRGEGKRLKEAPSAETLANLKRIPSWAGTTVYRPKHGGPGTGYVAVSNGYGYTHWIEITLP